ncbi:MAG: SDR family NAD(P)-dependent oxidoreductase [Bacteroidales bacterium]|nr:SDR family NAD(P)-dependent oxidoreductase [Bacteroidales bacterium]
MTALITGGSSGMGLEYASQLAAKGYDLILVSNREEELKSAGERLETAYTVRVTTHFQDLAAPDAADLLYDWCVRQCGILPDVLINNAGMFFFKELSIEDLDRVQAMLNLHMVTVTRSCLLFGEAMKKRGSGRILIMSSMAARIPAPGITIYSATKAYLKSFGRSLSYELKPYGVSVTTVCPAAIATPLYRLDEKKMKLGVRCGLIHTPKWLVRRAIRAMLHGRRVISPSLMNLWLPALIALLPGPLVAAIWKRLK